MGYKFVKVKNGMPNIKKLLLQIARTKVEVGVFEGKKKQLKSRKKYARKKIESDITMAEVAKINEYGSISEKIPARRFIKQTFTSNDNFRKQVRNLVSEVMAQKENIQSQFELLGVIVMQRIQRQITKGNFKENADSTIEKKGSDRPLMDFGQLRQSIGWRILKK